MSSVSDFLFNQKQRHCLTQKIGLYIKNDYASFDAAHQLLNDPEFDADIAAAIADPTTAESKAFTALVEKSINLFLGLMPFSSSARRHKLGDFLATTRYVGRFKNFDTVSPDPIGSSRELESGQHMKTAVGSVGEFYVPAGKRQHTSKEDREVKKNEERTATGIVVRRNFNPTGTLEIYNIDTGTRVNRCRVKLLRQPSAALKAQIYVHSLLPLTLSNKRAKTPSEAPQHDPSRPAVVNDTEDRRGENDAPNQVEEPSLVDEDAQSTDVNPDLPVVRSTDDTTTLRMWQLLLRLQTRMNSLRKTTIIISLQMIYWRRVGPHNKNIQSSQLQAGVLDDTTTQNN